MKRQILVLGLGLFLALAEAMPQPQEGKSENPELKKSRHDVSTTLEQNEKYCLSSGCVLAAAEIIKHVDDTVDPCDDFYEYACGGYIKESVIPDHQTSKGSFSDLRDKLYERLKIIFESKSTKNEPKVYSDVRNFYASCVDEPKIEKSSIGELKNLIEKLGGWPVLLKDKWSEEGFKCYKTIEKAAGLGFDQDVLVTLGISTDDSNSTRRIIEIDQPSFGMSREYLIKGFEDKDVQAYYTYMVSVATYLGADEERAKEELKEVLLMEIGLAERALPKEERRNKTALFNQMTISKAEELMEEGFDLTGHINNLFHSMVGESSVEVASDEIINVAVPGYLKNLTEYMPTVKPRVLANYMMWRYVKSLLGFMDKTVLGYSLEYTKALTGKKQRAPRWDECVKSVAGLGGDYLYFYEGSLTNAVGAMYSKKYFPLEQKKAADEMVENIREEFKIMIDELTWMDDTTKEKAKKKAEQMTSWMAYAEEILDDELLQEYYQDLELNSDSYLQNHLSLKKYINSYYVNHLRDPKEKNSWKEHGGAAIVNAFYSPQENSIQFPAGILSGVFFEADRPLYMNYAAIGWVVGHEITHGFDDQGSQRDGDGNLVDWWEPTTKENYLEKAKCIIDQYGKINVTIESEDGDEDQFINLNGINTQGENIADNGGLKEALRAYNRLMGDKEEPLLPGLQKYSQKQLFWLSGASVWCTAMRPAQLKNNILTDPHSPSRYRVNIPLANNRDFAKDWNCPRGSKMNPEDICEVW